MTKIIINFATLIILLASELAFAGAFMSRVPAPNPLCASSAGRSQLGTGYCSVANRYVVGGVPGNWSIFRHTGTTPRFNCQGTITDSKLNINCTDFGWTYHWNALVPLARAGCPACLGVVEQSGYRTTSTTPPSSPAGWRMGGLGGVVMTTITSLGGNVFWTRDYTDGNIRLRPYTGAVNQLWTQIP